MPTPVPNPPKAPPALVGAAAVDNGLGPGPAFGWNEDLKPETGTDWIERNLLGGGRSSLLYCQNQNQ